MSTKLRKREISAKGLVGSVEVMDLDWSGAMHRYYVIRYEEQGGNNHFKDLRLSIAVLYMYYIKEKKQYFLAGSQPR